MGKLSVESAKKIALMQEGGSKLAQILQKTLVKVKPGLSTFQIDQWIEEEILKAGGLPSFKTVKNYKHASCVGLNSEVVHSIPKTDKIIKKGDLLKVDLGMLWQGFHTDLSWTVKVGEEDKDDLFLNTGKKALRQAIKAARVGNRVGHVSQTIENIVKESGFSPVAVLTGHGIGGKLHQDPLIPGILAGKIENTPELKAGMTLAIEIIYNFGSPEVVLETDGWTICTKDGKISGLFEETIAVTENEPLVLTPIGFINREN